MGKAHFRPEVKETLDSFLLDVPGVRAGKMFGLPGYFVGGKLFACLYQDGVGIKVPATTAVELLERDEVTPFQPFEKSTMREWVQVTHPQPDNYFEDESIFLQSIEFVLSLAQQDQK